MKKRVLSTFFGLLILACGFFFSCEVGLGEAVDTYPPTLTLEYPANDGITVMNTFQMSGVAKDETYIKTVEVIVKTIPKNNKDTSTTIQKYLAEVDPKAKTWSCAINEMDSEGNFQIPDGEYTFQIIATDSSDRTTELSRVYKIDNTAPVVILQRPNMEDKFGRTIKVTGDISDENELSALYFTAFRNKGTEESPVFEQVGETQKYENISGVGLEIIVGRYFDSDENLTDNERLQKAVYDAYYDKDIGGTQNFYCMVEVSDSAKEYRGTLSNSTATSGNTLASALIPAGGTYTGTVTGNLSTCYYLNNDIRDEILQDVSKGGLGLTKNDLVTIMNGTYTETSIVKIDNVKKILSKYAISTSAFSDNVSMFSLNPDNSPYYQANGFEQSKGTSLTKNGMITIMVYQGRDQISLRENTIRFVLDKCDSFGRLEYEGAQQKENEIVLVESKSNIDALKASSDSAEVAKGEALLDSWKETFENGDFIKMSVSASGTTAGGVIYKTGSYYKIRVDGEDYDGNYIESYGDQNYMFKFVNGQAPILNVTGGTEDNSVQKTPYEFAGSSRALTSDQIFNYSGTLSSDSGIEDLKVFYYITVKDEKGTKSYSTKADTLKDRTAVITENPDTTDTATQFVWSLELNEDSEAFEELYTKAKAGGTDLSNGLYLYTIYFYAYDGTQTTATVSQRVHVDTQKPVTMISGISPTVEFESVEDLPYSDMQTGINYVNGEVTVSGTVTDNYTLENTIARAYLVDASGKKADEPFAVQEFGDSMSYNFKINTLAEGVEDQTDMLIEIVSVDKAGNEGEPVTQTVRIDQRTDEPVFTPSNASKNVSDAAELNEDTNMFGKNSNNTIVGTVTDDDGVWGWFAYYSTDGGSTYSSTPFASKVQIESTSANISVNLKNIPSLSEGQYKIKIEVKDKNPGDAQKVTTNEFYIAIDEAAPVIVINSAQRAYVSADEGATIKGKVSDGSQEIKSFTRKVYRVERITDESGAETEKRTLISDEKEISSTALSTTTGSAVKNGVEFTDWVDLTGEDDSGIVVYTAKDKYGRTQEAEYEYYIDNEKPTVTIADTVKAVTYLAKGSATMGFKGTAWDNIPNGLDSVQYAIVEDGTAAADVPSTAWASFNGTDNWNSTIDFGDTAEGKKTVYVRALDAAGNYTAPENYGSRSVIIDAEEPLFDETKFKVEYVAEGAGDVPQDSDGNYYVNQLFKISGTVTDDYYFTVGCSVGGTFETAPVTGSTGGDFVWKINALSEGSKNYVFTAKDLAGQTKQYTITIVTDTVAPSPKLNLASYYDYVAGIGNNAGTYTVNEKITFTGSASDTNEVVESIISGVLVSASNSGTSASEAADTFNSITVENPSNFSQVYDTTAIVDGIWEFTVSSKDIAGNVGTAKIKVNVDQSTDLPQITSSNAKFTVVTQDMINLDSNLFGATSNNKIMGVVSDDDGLSSVIVQYTLNFTDAEPNDWTTIQTFTPTGATYNLTIPLVDENKNALQEKDYRIRIVAYDKKSSEGGLEATTSDSKKNTAGPFYIGIDEGLPVIDIDRQDGEMLAAEQSVSVTGKVSDGSGVVTLKRYRQAVKDDGTLDVAREEATIKVVNGNTDRVSWEDTFESLASSEVLTYTATDKYGRTATKSFRYQVDDADPTISVAAPEDNSFLGSAYGNTTKAFSGTAADNNGTGRSGVREILYRVGTIGESSVNYGTALDPDTDPAVASWRDTWLKADGTTTWNANIELGSTSTKKKIQICAVDGADRTSEIIERTVTVDASIPRVTIGSVTDTVNGASRVVTAQEGTYYVQSGYTITGTIEEENLDTLKISGTPVTPTDNNDGTHSFSYSVTAPQAGQNTISIVALDKAGQQTELSLNVFYDTSAPTPSFTITPIISAKGADGVDRDNNINGNVTIKGTSIDDDKVAVSHLVIKYSDGAKAGVKVYDADTTSPTNFVGSVPLSAFINGDGYNYLGTIVKIDDRQLYTVELTSTDRSGRVGMATAEVYVDESTDNPIVTLSNTNVDINSASDVSSESGHNLFNQTSNSKMLGTITDDDGIKSILVEYAPVTNGTDGTYQQLSKNENCGTTYNFASDLKAAGAALPEGKYKIRITVLDITETAENHKTVEEFYLAIDNGAPSITVSTDTGYKKETFKVEGKASDAALKSILRYTVTNGIRASTPSAKWEAGASSNTIEYNSSTKVWKDNYTGISSGGNVLYIAEDEYGQSTEVSWTYLFDNTAPTKAPGWTPSDMSAWSKNSAQQFKIPVSDRWNVAEEKLYDLVSGISSVNIKVDSDDASTMALGSPYEEIVREITTTGDDGQTSTEEVKPYNWYNSTQILKDGHHTVVISAADNATPANTADNLATYEVNIDTVAPKYTPYTSGGTDFVKASKNLLTADDVANLTSNPFTLKVKPSDANTEAVGGAVSGIKEFKLYDGNTLIDSSKYELSPAANGTTGIFASGVEYTFTLNASAVNQTGNHNFYVETIDGAGNSVKESVSVAVDVTAPALEFNEPSPYVNVTNNGATAKYYNGKITVSGKVTDETKLGTTDALEYEILNSSGSSFSPKKTGKVTLHGGKSDDWSFDIDTTALAENTGTFKVKVTAQDAVGNKADNASSLIVLNVDQTTDKPVVKLSNANVKVTTEAQISSTAVTSETASANKGNLFGMGNDSIFASVTDDDGIASIVLKIDGEEVTKSDGSAYFDVGTETPTSYAMEIPLKTLGLTGTHYVTIEVTDKNAGSGLAHNTYSTNTDSVSGVFFAYDDDLPTISVTKINDSTYADSMWTQTNSKVHIVVSDSSSSDSHTGLTVTNDVIQVWNGTSYVDRARASGENAAISWSSTDNAFIHNAVNENFTYKRKYTVTDKYGRSSTKEISYMVDNEKPVFHTDKVSVQGTNTSASNTVATSSLASTWFSTSSLKVVGEAGALVEANPETVLITVGTDSTPVNPTNSDSNKGFGTTLQLSEGANTIKFDATDKAGYSADQVSITVYVDTVAPTCSSIAASDSFISGADVAALGTTPFKLSVTVSDATSGISSFRIYDGNTDITEHFTIPAASGNKTYEFALKAASASTVITTGTHTFAVETYDLAGNKVKDTVSVAVDVTAPTLEFNEVSPYVNVTSGDTTVRKYNGVVTVSGRAKDETELGTTGALTYEILKSDGTSFSPKKEGTVNLVGGLSSDWTFDVDTTSLSATTGTFKVKVTALDKVSNAADNSSSLIVLNVDQTTDKPVVKLSNANVLVTTAAQISNTAVTSTTASENKGNLFGMGNDSIFASATDDDGIASIELKVFYDDGNGSGSYVTIHKVGDATKPYFEVSDSPTSYAMEIDLTKVLSQVRNSNTSYAGTYKLALVVKDIYNQSSLTSNTYTVNSDSVNGVYFAYDDDLPTINVTKIGGSNYTDGMWTTVNADVVITVSDSSSSDNHTGLTVTNETIQWWDANQSTYVTGTAGSGESATAVWDEPNSVFKHSTVNSDKTYKRKYRVTDKYGRSSTKEISYVVDNVVPVFNLDNVALFGSSPSIGTGVTAADGVVIGTSKDYWFNSDAVKVIGRGSAAGQALVEEHPESVTITAGGTNYPVNPGEFNKFSTTISFADGENTIKFNATDKAGNSAVEVTQTLKVDTKSPVISSVSTSAAAINGSNISNPFYITVAASDANSSATGGKVSGIKGFTVYDGTTELAAAKYTVRTGTAATSALASATNGVYADGTYYIHLDSSVLTTGDHTFYVEVTDNADNTSKEKTALISIDVTPPTMSWNVPSPFVQGETDKLYNGIITVSGTVTDETLLATDNPTAAESATTRSVSWEVKTSAGASLATPVKGYAVLSGNKTSSFSFDIDTTRVQTETGTYRIYITAKDNVGNEVSKAGSGSGAGVDYIELKIDQTTNKPKVVISSLKEVTEYSSEYPARNLFGMGNTIIYGTVTDDDGVSAVTIKIDDTVIQDDTIPDNHPTSYAIALNLEGIRINGQKITSGAHKFTIEVVDCSTGLSDTKYVDNKDVKDIYFAYDDDLPTISVARCNDKDYTNNMWGKAEFDVYISVQDATDMTGETLNVECTEIKRSDNGKTGTYTPYTLPEGTVETVVWTPSLTIDDNGTAGDTSDDTVITNVWKCPTHSNEGYFQRTYKVTDKYGRSTTTAINYIVDGTVPEFNNSFITVQGTSNRGTSAISISTLNTEEYSDTWFSSSSIKISGSGSSYTGNNTAIKEQNVETLVINANGTQYPVNTGTNNKFNSTVDFEDGSAKQFSLTVTDKAGNSANAGPFTVNVDTTAPTDVTGELKKADGSTAVSDNSIINDTVLKLSVTAKDTTSGVKTIYVGKTPGFPKTEAIKTEVLTSANATAAGYSGIITLNVGDSTSGNKEYLADGTYSLYIRVEDLAGNISDGSTAVASFTVDRTAPAVTITTPVCSTVIDNEWIISGTVSDNNFVANGSLPELWVYKNSAWVKIDTASGYGTSSIVSNSAARSGNDWHITLDSTKINPASGSKTDAFLAVRIKDAAGNVTALPTGTPSKDSETFYYLTVDQDNDRPVIKFTEVTGDGSTTANTYLVKYATYIKGTVTDGDGNGLADTTFKVSPTAITTSAAWDSFTNETTGTTLTNGKVERKASGDFTYTPANGDDGTHTVYFYYKDKAGKEFWTGHSNPLNRPFVIWADTEVNVDNNTVITYRTDKNRPEFVAIVCGLGSTKAEAEADAVKKIYGTGGQSDEMATVTVAGGLSRKFIAFAVKASDANGIKQVTYKDPTKTSGAADETVALTATSKKGWNIENNTVVTAVETETDTIKNVEAYFFDGIDVSSICPAEGSPTEKSVVISVQDTSELDNEKPKTMQFTCIGPEISVDAPLPTDTVSAGTKAKLSGIVTSAATGITNADLKFIYVNNKVYDALDSAGASGRTEGGAETVTNGWKGYTFPTTVSYGGKSGTEAKIAYIKAQAASHTEGHPIVKTVSDMTDGTASKFNWDITTTFPSEDTGAPEICYVPHTTDGKYTLPLWILATDTLGNETLLEYNVTYNPFGDRPVAQITYPEKKVEKDSATNTNVTRDYAVISGNIRVSGAATDNISVDSVYLQVDADNDGDFDADDAAYLISKHYTVYATSAAGITGAVEITGGNFDADSGFWGIKTTGSASWYISLNSENEFQTDATKVLKDGTTEVNYYNIKVRAVALDNNKKLGAWSDALVIHIDPNAPKIGKNVAAYVLDSENNKHNYSADMYVKGETYLCVSVQHQGGITNISYKESDDQSTISMAADTKLVDNSAIVTGKADITGSLITNWTGHADLAATGAVTSDKGYLLKIPLNTNSGDGSRAVKVSATYSNNGVALTSEDIFTFNYDNTAPTIKEVYVNENTVWEAASSVALQNSNYKLTIKNDVQDDKAGFNFALWYFYRDDRTATDTQIAANGLNRRVYDPSIKYGSDYATSHAREDVSGSDGAIADGFTKQTVSGLPVYGKTITVTRSAGAEGTLTLPAVDKHVTNGSAVLINGEWLLLSGSTDNLTFNLSGTVPVSVTSAFFPYAKVTAYNTGLENAENWNENGGTISQDDGDGIIESVTKAGTTSTWSAAFHGDYIPDGKVTMVLVAFDKSGNSSAISRTGKVQNNAPRLSKLHLATDLNGDGTFADAEFETYNLLEKEGDYQSDYDLATAGYGKTEIETARPAFIVKDTLGVVPEFTGGNGDIALVYKLNDTTGKTGSSRDVTTANGGGKISTTATAATGAYTSGNTVFTSGNHNWFYKMTNADVTGKTGDETPVETDDGTGKHISFTFWDSTDECEQGSDSQSCYVQLTDLTVDVTDGVAPKVNIEPFFWSGKGFTEQTVTGSSNKVYVPNNSLYYAKDSNGKYTDTVNGHIELSGDLPTATFNVTNTASSGEYDNDPKVSGKIVVRGTAYDDVRIDSIWVSFDNFTITGMKTDSTKIKGTGTTTTTSTVTTGSYAYTTALGGDGKTYYLAAKYSSSSGWSTVGDLMDSKSWGFKIIDDGINDQVESLGAPKAFFDQRGHRVAWELYLDTAHLTNVAGLDKSIRVMAVDANGTLPSSTTESVTSAYTSNNKPAYKVDVVPYITDILTGDLDTGTTRKHLRRSASGAFVTSIDDAATTQNANNNKIIVNGFNLKGGKVYLGTTAKTTAASGNTLTVLKNLLTSGEIKVVNNSVNSLNNVNNDAKDYNKEPAQYAPNLVDNRYIYMWDTTTTTYSGAEAVMKPEINTSGVKTGNMVWYYASNIEKMYQNDMELTSSWGGAIVGGNFAYNDVGVPSWVYLHNTSWTTTANPYKKYYEYGSVHWGKTWFNYSAKSWNVNRTTNNHGKLGLGNLSFEGSSNYNFNDTVMSRYQNIKVLASGNATDTLNMVAYFDKSDVSRSIVFWRFHDGTGITSKNYELSRNNNNVTSYSDIGKSAGQTQTYENRNSTASNGMDTPLGRENLTSGGADSKYFDMAYDSVKNVAYIAYYDEAAGALKIMYLNNPKAGTYGNWTNSWSNAVEIDPDAAGQYIAMKTDGSGNIHLAYYDSTGSYLKYALITPTGNTGAITALTVSKKVLVDTLFSNGMYNSITLKQFATGDVRPVICSYSISFGGTKYSLRTSWPLTTVANIEAGADDDGYTGKWETVVVCSANAPSQDNTYIETNSTGYTGNIVVGYTASKLEQAELKGELKKE